MHYLTFGLIIAMLLSWLAYMLLSPCRYHLHMLQLNTYVNSQQFSWLKQHKDKLWRPWELLLLAPLLVSFSFTVEAGLGLLIPWLLLWIYRPNRLPAKKPLVLTQRMKRLYRVVAALLGLWLILVVTVLYLASFGGHWLWQYFTQMLLLKAALVLGALLAPLWVLLANKLLAPRERRINMGFFTAAQAKLKAMPQTTTVAITGSYGKTSVKMFLAAILAEKYETLATPQSYNTPMGVSRVINDQLRPTTEMFVCEMGARHVQDIGEMCDLAQPDIAILTAIGQQHLETFGSEANIIRAKTDIIRCLAPGGTAFVNGDCALITDNLAEFTCPIVSYGLEPHNDWWAQDISFDAHGASFTLRQGDDSWPMTTPLLGRHNICNLVGCAAVAHHLGVDMKRIAHALRGLQPVEHRLQLIPAGSYTVIDDAFNSNPAGAKAALEVLASFQGGQRIIITPGMVELGEEEYRLNFELGRLLPASCDRIILVGREHSRPLQEGATAAGVKEGQLFVAGDLEEARSILAGILGPGDVVLYENDLPDTYNE